MQGAGEQTFRFYNTATSGSTRVSWKMANRNNPDWTWIWYTDSLDNGTNDITLQNRTSVALRVDTNANIGIGITNPKVRLQTSSATTSPSPTLGTASGALYISNNDTAYGLLSGVAATGDAWLQVQRTDGTATAYNLLLQPSGGSVGISMTPTFRLDVTGAALGATSGNQSQIFRLTSTSANVDNLEFTNTRTANGSDWTTAGYRLQQKVDATWMAYIQFNGSAGSNQGGLSFGTGTTTTSAISVLERLRIATDGRITGLNSAILDIPYVTNAQTAASYSVQASDSGKIIEMNNAGANTVTVPNLSTVATGAQITIIQTGAGQTTVAAGASVTINGTPGLKLRTQWSTATLIKRTTGATDVWILTGDLVA